MSGVEPAGNPTNIRTECVGQFGKVGTIGKVVEAIELGVALLTFVPAGVRNAFSAGWANVGAIRFTTAVSAKTIKQKKEVNFLILMDSYSYFP